MNTLRLCGSALGRTFAAAAVFAGMIHVVVAETEEFPGPEKDRPRRGKSDAISFKAPAGELPAVREITIDGYRGAVLPNGRLITPVGTEVNVDAPKPFGLALSQD